jgi:hypothetical protein
LTLKTDSSVVPGTYPLTIQGAGAIIGTVGTPKSHAMTITLNIS